MFTLLYIFILALTLMFVSVFVIPYNDFQITSRYSFITEFIIGFSSGIIAGLITLIVGKLTNKVINQFNPKPIPSGALSGSEGS